MLIGTPAAKRQNKQVDLAADLTVVGGGLAGTCCAITAARQGLKVVLIQDRPLLGGNSSSEVRLWVLGATSHMGNNNRWAREGGVINEILIENTYRNEESNPLIFDAILLEKVIQESNITLLLNTAVLDLDVAADNIERVKAFCSQNSTAYMISSPLFCDASGDGIVGFLAGAAFRMGAESKEEFGEKFAPSKAYGELLGHSLYFYTKNTDYPVKFVRPSFALDDITKIPRYRKFSTSDQGCNLWWVEYGGRLDTIHDTESIKWELWKVVYGIWNYIKNSGHFPEAENMTLEWVGTIPGKRESRRFEGDYMLRQQDIIEQRKFDDVVAFGGWSIDLHPADGVFSELPGCNQWHSKGIYGIPYRCYYSKNIKNLFLAGRIISATHVAFGSSRVMATCAHGGQAVAMAAKLAKKYNVKPSIVGEKHIKELQLELLKSGQHLPHLPLHDHLDLAKNAVSVTASSTMLLTEMPVSKLWKPILHSAAQMLPIQAGKLPQIKLWLNVLGNTDLQLEIRKSSKNYNHTPDVILYTEARKLKPGKQEFIIDVDLSLGEDGYVFVCLMKNEQVELAYSDKRISGLLTVFNSINPAVSNYGKQQPTEDIGVEEFEFWCPERRPGGHNFAMNIEPGLKVFAAENLRNGWQRPVSLPNAWVAAYDDRNPKITISWESEVTIKNIALSFDCDYDHPMENVLRRQPEDVQPFCATGVKVYNCNDVEVGSITNNYQAQRTIHFAEPVTVKDLKLVLTNVNENAPVSLFEVRCYG